MNTIELKTIADIIGSTHQPSDEIRCLAALSYGLTRGHYATVRAMILSARADYLAYTTRVQRKWQGLTRNPNKARFHDSISLREKYVRC